MSYLDSRIIILNSAYGILNNGTYKSDILFKFNGLLTQEDDIEQVQISLVNAQIPVSFYTINYTNNVFKIKLGNNNVQFYYIQVGNYNANSLILSLNTLINDSNFTITISKITGKLTFAYTTSFIIYTDNDASICAILGLELGLIYNSTGILLCPYPLDLLGYKRLEIYTLTLSTYNYSSLNNGMCCLLSIIPIDQPACGLIVYNNFTDTKHIIKNNTLDSIDIQIKGEDENFINFNNIDWTMKLKLDITRKKPLEITKNNYFQQKPIEKLKENKDIIKNDFDLLTYN